jgi:hypothetical protein
MRREALMVTIIISFVLGWMTGSAMGDRRWYAAICWGSALAAFNAHLLWRAFS